jgi:hypothetical protein
MAIVFVYRYLPETKGLSVEKVRTFEREADKSSSRSSRPRDAAPAPG